MSKETHSFSVSVACAVGERGAIMIQHVFFLQKYVANNYKIEVPDAWAKRSLRELAATYSYLTEKQIRATLDGLIKDGFLFEKIENENKYDRSKSYQLSANGFILIGEDAFAQMGRWILPNGQNDSPEWADDICPNGQMLDYNSYNEVSNDIITKEESEKNAFFGEAGKSELNHSFGEEKKEKLPPNSARPPKKEKTGRVPHTWSETLAHLQDNDPAMYMWAQQTVKIWEDWMEYRIENKKCTPYGSAKTEVIAVKQLHKLAEGKESNARAIVEYVRANGYQGIYLPPELKQQPGQSGYKRQEKQGVNPYNYG